MKEGAVPQTAASFFSRRLGKTSFKRAFWPNYFSSYHLFMNFFPGHSYVGFALLLNRNSSMAFRSCKAKLVFRSNQYGNPDALLALAFFSLISLCYAQQNHIDSLENLVKTTPNDTTKVWLLNRLVTSLARAIITKH